VIRGIKTFSLVLCCLLAGLVAGPATSRDAGKALLPDLVPFPGSLEDHYVENSGGRKLLRFSSGMVNVGDGALEVIGRRQSLSQPVIAQQCVYERGGVRRKMAPFGEFEFHAEHGHWHLLQVAIYRLLNEDGTEAAAGNKVSFCLLDEHRIHPRMPRASSTRRYHECVKSPRAKFFRSGLSVGWGDLYDHYRDGQWVDITDVAPGRYTLQVELNPDGVMLEKSRDNNIHSIPVTIR